MACGYDTQTVLEMLSDLETDNGIEGLYTVTQNSDSSCSDDENE